MKSEGHIKIKVIKPFANPRKFDGPNGNYRGTCDLNYLRDSRPLKTKDYFLCFSEELRRSLSVGRSCYDNVSGIFLEEIVRYLQTDDRKTLSKSDDLKYLGLRSGMQLISDFLVTHSFGYLQDISTMICISLSVG